MTVPAYVDLVGKVFGRLTVTEEVRIDGIKHCKCVCSCGNKSTLPAKNLTRKAGATRSCGCLSKDAAAEKNGRKHVNFKHGQSVGGKKSRAYSIWSGMLDRCYRESNKSFRYYGGRGIVVCHKWHTFRGFIDDMGAPGPCDTIERINVNGDYEPNNCVWLPAKLQPRNSRQCLQIELDGVVKPLSVWCEDLGLNYFTTYSRIVKLNWTVTAALKNKGDARKKEFMRGVE